MWAVQEHEHVTYDDPGNEYRSTHPALCYDGWPFLVEQYERGPLQALAEHLSATGFDPNDPSAGVDPQGVWVGKDHELVEFDRFGRNSSTPLAALFHADDDFQPYLLDLLGSTDTEAVKRLAHHLGKTGFVSPE